jgi:hypothetical protein
MKKLVHFISASLLCLAALYAPVMYSQVAQKGSAVSKGAVISKTEIVACPETNYAAYLALPSCWQNTSVMTWSTYTCSDDGGSGLCATLGTNGALFEMTLDHGGCLPLNPCPNTLFMGKGSLPANPGLTSGQMLHVTLSGTLYGATKFNPWPHYKQAGTSFVGQTGNGTVEWKFTVVCGAGCSGGIGNSPEISDMVCNSANHSNPECNEQTSEAPYAAYNLSFSAATAGSPYAITCELIMTANTGTAFAVSNGMHWVP